MHQRTMIVAQSMQILDRKPEEPEPVEAVVEEMAEQTE
jgi:hypothetical protein